jgi:hypothetical protein
MNVKDKEYCLRFIIALVLSFKMVSHCRGLSPPVVVRARRECGRKCPFSGEAAHSLAREA